MIKSGVEDELTKVGSCGYWRRISLLLWLDLLHPVQGLQVLSLAFSHKPTMRLTKGLFALCLGMSGFNVDLWI